MQSIHTQIRQVARKLARSPLFTTLAVVTLAVGIGANTAIFSVVTSQQLSLQRPLRFQLAMFQHAALPVWIRSKR